MQSVAPAIHHSEPNAAQPSVPELVILFVYQKEVSETQLGTSSVGGLASA
jgi:hypothetical protein